MKTGHIKFVCKNITRANPGLIDCSKLLWHRSGYINVYASKYGDGKDATYKSLEKIKMSNSAIQQQILKEQCLQLSALFKLSNHISFPDVRKSCSHSKNTSVKAHCINRHNNNAQPTTTV